MDGWIRNGWMDQEWMDEWIVIAIGANGNETERKPNRIQSNRIETNGLQTESQIPTNEFESWQGIIDSWIFAAHLQTHVKRVHVSNPKDHMPLIDISTGRILIVATRYPPIMGSTSNSSIIQREFRPVLFPRFPSD